MKEPTPETGGYIQTYVDEAEALKLSFLWGELFNVVVSKTAKEALENGPGSSGRSPEWYEVRDEWLTMLATCQGEAVLTALRATMDRLVISRDVSGTASRGEGEEMLLRSAHVIAEWSEALNKRRGHWDARLSQLQKVKGARDAVLWYIEYLRLAVDCTLISVQHLLRLTRD